MPAPEAVESDVAERAGQRVGQIDQLVHFIDLARQVGESVEDVGRVLQFFEVRLVRSYHGQRHAEENSRSLAEEQIPDAKQHADVQHWREQGHEPVTMNWNRSFKRNQKSKI